jgi:hypothetical protein
VVNIRAKFDTALESLTGRRAVNLGGNPGGGGGNNVPEPGTLAILGAGLLATFAYSFKGLRANAQS